MATPLRSCFLLKGTFRFRTVEQQGEALKCTHTRRSVLTFNAFCCFKTRVRYNDIITITHAFINKVTKLRPTLLAMLLQCTREITMATLYRPASRPEVKSTGREMLASAHAQSFFFFFFARSVLFVYCSEIESPPQRFRSIRQWTLPARTTYIAYTQGTIFSHILIHAPLSTDTKNDKIENR